MENKTEIEQQQKDNKIAEEFLREYEKLVHRFKRHFTPLVNMAIAKLPDPPPPPPETPNPPKK